MGLDTTHNAWHGSYSSFNGFRTFIANLIGITLDDMDSYGGDKSWDNVKDDLKHLLNHSDCDGHITPVKCAKIAKRLRELLKNWPEGSDYRDKAEQFAKGCELAAKKKQQLKFH
jgi:hypothetical protein